MYLATEREEEEALLSKEEVSNFVELEGGGGGGGGVAFSAARKGDDDDDPKASNIIILRVWKRRRYFCSALVSRIAKRSRERRWSLGETFVCCALIFDFSWRLQKIYRGAMPFPTKKVKKRKGIQTKEEVKEQCTSGRLDENARKLIQEAVDAFRAEVEKQKVEISAKDFAGIVKALRDAKLIPEDAKVLDFPTKQTGERLDATPWIGIFEGETDIAADIHFSHRLGGNGTTLVYVVECEKEP